MTSTAVTAIKLAAYFEKKPDVLNLHLLISTRLTTMLMAVTGRENSTIRSPRSPLQSSAVTRLGIQHIKKNNKNAGMGGAKPGFKIG
ncbi:hypothetical protein DFR42_103496 [Undibacterium pigrum]|uniref:Uncharacterized protein n=1 Tax=Undibacterium pigrum TaxID=401470 RepID=A0A318JBQ3_9BURK|nr:hypothetical protein DFR42_103496 [Undibacterium pigrum]